jgi:hypothetical protein
MKKTHIMNQWTCRFALAGISLMGLSAFAQDAESLNNGTTAPATDDMVQSADQSTRLPVTVSVGGSEQFNTDIDKNNAGSFSITRGNVGVTVPVRLNENFTLATSGRYGLDYYDFSDTPAGITPWKYINTVSAASILSYRDKGSAWSYYGGGFVKMSAESGVALNRAASGGGLIGFNYKFDDTLTLGLGIAGMSVLEDSARVLPIITAKWKFADNWVLDAGLTDVATAGYGVDVKWLFDKEWDFSLGAQFHQSRFRIDGAGPVQNGIATEEATQLLAGATWHASEKVDLMAFAGVAVGGKLKIADSQGDHEQEADYKTAGILGLKASFKF